MTTTTTVERLADAITAAAPQVDEAGRQIALALWDLLAAGSPVTTSSLATRAGVDEALVTSTLDGWPGVFQNEAGSVVGFLGFIDP